MEVVQNLWLIFWNDIYGKAYWSVLFCSWIMRFLFWAVTQNILNKEREPQNKTSQWWQCEKMTWATKIHDPTLNLSQKEGYIYKRSRTRTQLKRFHGDVSFLHQKLSTLISFGGFIGDEPLQNVGSTDLPSEIRALYKLEEAARMLFDERIPTASLASISMVILWTFGLCTNNSIPMSLKFSSHKWVSYAFGEAANPCALAMNIHFLIIRP